MSVPFLHRASVALSIAGILVSAYLTYAHVDERALACGIGDCATVQASAYSTVAGIPVAVLGLVAYAALGVMAVARLIRPSLGSWIEIPFWGGTLAGTIYSGYLTYVELFILDAICQWCVISAVVMTALLASETALVIKGDSRA